MNKEALEQLNKLYAERCKQLMKQNAELNMKIELLNKAVKERNVVIEQLLADGKSMTTNTGNDITKGDEFQDIYSQKKDIPDNKEAVNESANHNAPVTSVSPVNGDFSNEILSDIQEFAAQQISRMVIKSAESCNVIASSNSADKKQLLNLIIGKCENTKYEITDILLSECSEEQKRKMITNCSDEAIEYFGCVLQQ